MSRPTPAGPVIHDDEGNPIPQPSPESDLADLIQLLEYCRMKGFRLGPTIRVGKIVTSITDLRQHDPRRDKDEAPAPSIWAEAGYTDDGGGTT